MTRVLFAGGGTGGHLYPALTIAAALREEDATVEVHFVGAMRGIEARVLPREGVPHTLLPLEPIHRDRVWRNVRLPLTMAKSLAGLRKVYAEFEPALFVGTGGYASGPAGLWAMIAGVPVALQEQNSVPGLTQRLLARRAACVFLGFPEAAEHLRAGDRTRLRHTGNPVRPPDDSLDRDASRRGFGLDPAGVVALVVGGSQGALAVNDALLETIRGVVEGSLPPAPNDLQILWATGPAHIDRVEKELDGLRGPEGGRSEGFAARVRAHGYIDEMPAALASADFAISRAGAIMTAELLAWGIPAVLVPLPTAAADHQTRNARTLADAGAAIFRPQSDLTPASLWEDIRLLGSDTERRERMSSAAHQRGRPDAARQIARELLELARSSKS